MLLAAVASALLGLAPVPTSSRARVLGVASERIPVAFLTREAGKNGKLETLLSQRGVECEELPCIAFERLPGFDELSGALAEEHGWVVITSPEAAGVFVEAWQRHDAASTAAPPPRIASVGAGTAKVLAAAGLAASFVPSKATGKTLAAELPAPDPPAPVLYPASALASGVVQAGLADRGIETRRIETYTTVAATWAPEELERACGAQAVTFGSPSAVRVWADRVGTAAAALCIGETSAAEARRMGFRCVRCPESPGLDGWADAVASYYAEEFVGQ